MKEDTSMQEDHDLPLWLCIILSASPFILFAMVLVAQWADDA